MEVEPSISLPRPLQNLSTFIDTQPESIAVASNELQELALQATKYVFDLAVQTEAASRSHIEKLLETLTDVVPPQTRSLTKRKENTSIPEESQKKKSRISPLETPIPSLFVDGMTMEQIWEQLDLRGASVCGHLQVLDGESTDEDERGDRSLGEEDVDMDEDEEDEGEFEESEEDDDSIAGEEHVTELQDETSDDDEDDDGDEPTSMLDVIRKKPAKPKGEKHSQLDDGFFDLQEFNAETEEAEAKSASKGRLHHDSDSEGSEDADADIDLFGAVDDAEVGEDDIDGEYFYKDFFDAPKSSKSRVSAITSKQSKVRFHDEVKVKNIKAKGRGLPVSTMMYEVDEDDEEDEDYVPPDDQEDEDVEMMLTDDSDEVESSEGGSEDAEDDGDDSDEEAGDEEASDEGEENEGNRWTMERIKDDLFAEDQEEEQPKGE
ncbi:hypothetical protein ID866_4651 [Astraeus odoratus]|nr:hypothetical protein ID866_4651 [Astraeus odoratus]